MKNWNWKQWTAFGIIVAVIITAIVCHLKQPEVTHAWLEIVAGVMFVLGCIAGYFLKKNNIVNEGKKDDKKLLLD